MMWLDYSIEQTGKNFKIQGEWPGEVMGIKKDGSENDHHLYQPNDRFIVNEDGWLVYCGKNTTD